MLSHDLCALAFRDAEHRTLVLDRREHENLRRRLSGRLRNPPELVYRPDLHDQALMSSSILRLLDRLFIGVKVDYADPPHQPLVLGKRPVDPQITPAAILHRDSLALPPQPHRNVYQPTPSAAHARAKQFVEF